MKKMFLFLVMVVACTQQAENRAPENRAPKFDEPPSAPTPKFTYAELQDADTWEIKLKKSIERRPKDKSCIYIPYMPDEIQDAFPLPPNSYKPGRGGKLTPMLRPGSPRAGYGIMDAHELRFVLASNDIDLQYSGAGASGGGYAYWALDNKNYDREWFNPIDYAYLILYRQTYLMITIPEPNKLHVRKLKTPAPTPRPSTIKIPQFKKRMVVKWSVEGCPWAVDKLLPSKLISGDFQNGYSHATTYSRGGLTVELPEEMTWVGIYAMNPKSKKRTWTYEWFAYYPPT